MDDTDDSLGIGDIINIPIHNANNTVHKYRGMRISQEEWDKLLAESMPSFMRKKQKKAPGEEHIESGEPFKINEAAMNKKLGINQVKIWRHRAYLIWEEFGTLLKILAWVIIFPVSFARHGFLNPSDPGNNGFQMTDKIMTSLMFGFMGMFIGLIVTGLICGIHSIWNDSIEPKITRIKREWNP